MKTLLLITLDFIRSDEPTTSLAIGSLLARLRLDPRYGREFTADHISFNVYDRVVWNVERILARISQDHDLTQLDAVAIGCYVWADVLVNPLISALRANHFRGKVILGGYQISNPAGLEVEYSGADLFILGYAEESLLHALARGLDGLPRLLNLEPDLQGVPSPYTTEAIKVAQGQGRVRLETKRGCCRDCAFCAHKDLQRRRVYTRSLDQVFEDLAYFHDKRVKKINVIDPLFNHGRTYRQVLHRCIGIGLKSRIALQVCFEPISGREGDEFLDLCASLDVVLEFGLQTAIKAEMENINRRNDLPHAREIIHQLAQRGISYEVSLMYGLPGQTFDSFKDSVRYLLDAGCQVIKCYPLKLLRGTALWRDRERWNLSESPEGRFGLPTVTDSDSFDRSDWNEMKSLSKAVRRFTERQSRPPSCLPGSPIQSPSRPQGH